MTMNVFIFDIETIPDVAGARRLWGLHGQSDQAVADVMYNKRNQQTGGTSDFPRHHLHRIVAISVVLRHADKLKVWSLGDADSSEGELITRFFDGIEKYSPTIVSWNGGGFDLPVLHYRALINGVSAPRYWDTGQEDTSFRYNNYLGRFHWRHIDLMDVISGYQGRAVAPLDDIASLLGYPGKLGMTGADVWSQFQAGKVQSIRDYCETDVLNTYLVYLSFERMRGHLQPTKFDEEINRLKDYLSHSEIAHFKEFSEAWASASLTEQ